MKIFLAISIDTECDKGPGWIIQRPMRFESVIKGVPDVFTPLFQKFGLKPTYLLSPEIIQNDECVRILEDCPNKELGTHLHGEFIEPEADFGANRTKTPQLAYSVAIERKKLENLTNAFSEKFGYQPTSFRAGRWGMSLSTLKILQELGYLVDSSVCSFRTHYFDGNRKVNFWGSPLQPYRPSYASFRRKGEMKIIEFPATLGNESLIQWPQFLFRGISDDTIFVKRVLRRLGFDFKISWLRPYRSTSEQMMNLTDSYVEKFGRNGAPVFLNMMFHSNEIIPGGSPYVKTEKQKELFVEELNNFFEKVCEKYEVEGIGLSDLASIL